MKRGNLEDRSVAQHAMDRRVGGHGGDEQRAEALHRVGTHDDLGDEQGARDRCVVGGGDTGRGAARGEQPATRRRRAVVEPHFRSHQSRQLHHRAFAPDRAAGGDRQQRGNAPQQRGAGADDAVADDDRFHVIDAARVAEKFGAVLQHQAGAEAADDGHDRAANADARARDVLRLPYSPVRTHWNKWMPSRNMTLAKAPRMPINAAQKTIAVSSSWPMTTSFMRVRNWTDGRQKSAILRRADAARSLSNADRIMALIGGLLEACNGRIGWTVAGILAARRAAAGLSLSERDNNAQIGAPSQRPVASGPVPVAMSQVPWASATYHAGVRRGA